MVTGNTGLSQVIPVDDQPPDAPPIVWMPNGHVLVLRADAVPMAALFSEASRKLAQTLRAACEMAKGTRHQGDNCYLSNMLDIFATTAEREAFGPAGLGEGGQVAI